MLNFNFKKIPEYNILANYKLYKNLYDTYPSTYHFREEIFRNDKGFIFITFNNIDIQSFQYSLIEFTLKNYGLKKNFLNFFLFRAEKRYDYRLEWALRHLKFYKSFLKILFKIIPIKFSIKNYVEINFLKLDLINSYRSYRHFYGFPSRGQRTWSNSNTTKALNNTIRNYKIKWMKKYFANVKCNDLRNVSVAEHYNLIWFKQWKHEWKVVSRIWEKAKLEVGFKRPKLDYKATAKKLVFSFWDKQYQKVKQRRKQTLRKNVYTLGFRPYYLKSIFRVKLNLNLLYKEKN